MISILIIDDNPDDLEYIADLLIQAQSDVQITSCESGAQGLAEVRKTRFDCVLLDLRLDGEDGFDVLSKLRLEQPLLRVIVLTGQGSEQTAADAFVAGAAYYLAKSQLSPTILWTAVTRVIHQAKLEQELQSKRVALERSNRLDAVGQLAAGIAHDFNNQLSTLRMTIERLQTEVANDKGQAYIDIAFTTIEESAQLASRLVALSRQGDLFASDVPLHDAFDNLRAMASAVSSENITLHVADVDKDLIAYCDRGQLVNALLNLVLNASDAIDEKDEAATISVTTERGQGTVRIIVKDNGTGMSEETLAKCSDPFFTTKQDRNGTGLGLAMIQIFASENGGELILQSTLGIGTEATLVLPEGRNDPVATKNARVLKKQPGVASNILLVEDQFLLARMTKEVLETAGFVIDIARDADEALAYLDGEHETRLIITDVKMPGMNGFELAKHLKLNHPTIKVMFLTGYAENPGHAEHELLGPILQKPVSSQQLIDTIHQVLSAE